MSEMFRCPKCKEVIRVGSPNCQYCNATIDEQTAHAEALKFQAGIDACAAASGWFTKYGSLQTDDPDFPETKQNVKKALILWLILSAIHVVVLTKVF